MKNTEKEESREWFHSRIGRTIFLTTGGCVCNQCLKSSIKGVCLETRETAELMYLMSENANLTFIEEPFRQN